MYVLHETLEVHEIAAFKSTCLTKSKTVKGLVTDPALKEILQSNVNILTRQLEELRGIMANSIQ